MRLQALLVVAVLGVLAQGCKGQCRLLAEKLCECSTNSIERDTCLRTAAAAESNAAPTMDDEKTCEGLLPSCDCRLLDTPQGKVKCGLARPPIMPAPDGG